MEAERTLRTESKTFFVRLAERNIEIHPLYDEILAVCREYICPNYTQPDLAVAVTDEDLTREKAYALEQKQKTGERVPYSLPYLETLVIYRKIASAMLAFNTFLMHGAVISTEGEGYMICAPSGTGKSTRTRLWMEEIPDSVVVNGDKPLLRVTEEEVIAYGTPWCGKEGWNTNTSVPLRAIFLLERGENEVKELNFADVFPVLLRQTFKPQVPNGKLETMRLLTKMADKVRVYRFRSEPSMEAVRMAWEAAREKP